MQAPRRRAEHRAKSEDRRTRLYAGIFAASGVLLVGGAFALVAFGGGGSSDVVGASGLIKTKSCTETSYPGLTAAHINNPDQKVKYNSFPPSSGPHYQQPSPWGLYDQPIQETILVHNLEHGGIILQYGHRVAPNVVSKIQAFWQGDAYGFVVAPYPKLGKRIAATAWNEPRYRAEGSFNDVKPGRGYVLMCTAFDESALAKFRDNHRNKGGERYPSVKDMAPNT